MAQLRWIKSEHIHRVDEETLKSEQEAYQEAFVAELERIARGKNDWEDEGASSFTAPGYGKRIKEIRTKTGLPQEGFAELIGSRRHTVSIWEIEYHRPSRKNYAALMAVAGGTP